MPKVTIIGAGQVGGLAAMRIAESGIADVVLLDIAKGICVGKALDMEDASIILKHDKRIIASDDFCLMEGSDIIVITAGFSRRPGMTREDLLNKNAEIVRDLAKKIAFDVIFEDLTVKYPYFYTIATQMHTFIPEIVEESDEIKKVWMEIQEYLNQIISEYTLPSVLPEKFLSDISDDTVISAFEEFQKVF